MPKMWGKRTSAQHRENESGKQEIPVQKLQPGVHAKSKEVGVQRRRTESGFAIITTREYRSGSGEGIRDEQSECIQMGCRG